MMDPDYDLFLAVVKAGSLSGAARAHFMSPAMVSKRLGRLENKLGTRLLHRSTRRMALTPQGERLHADLLVIATALAEAEARTSGDADLPSGPLRISAPTSFGRLHVAPHMGRFLQRYPQIALTLDLSDAFLDLYSAPVDIAIRITAQRQAGLTEHRLATSRRLLCASPDYLARHGEPFTIGALANHRLLAAEGQFPWQLSGPSGSINVAGPSFVTTNSSEVVRELAISGAGIALRSYWDVNQELAEGRLQCVLHEYEGSTDVGIFAVHPSMPLVRPALATFIAYLQTLYTPVAPWERA